MQSPVKYLTVAYCFSTIASHTEGWLYLDLSNSEKIQNANSLIFCSLENFTDSIRWSADLRWQRTGDPASSFGNKVVMRSVENPNSHIDWTPITDAKEGRNRQQDKALVRTFLIASDHVHLTLYILLTP